MTFTDVKFGSLEEAESTLRTQVEELMAIVDSMMSVSEATDWESADRTAYSDAQHLWNNDDDGLRMCLEDIAAEVGVSNGEYQRTVADNMRLF